MSSISERNRRWTILNGLMEASNLDALILAANDYRGHKGALRYVADYNLLHRSGHAVMVKGQEPTVILSGSLNGARRPASNWISDYRFPGSIAQGLVDRLREVPSLNCVGIVGLGQILKVDEYRALTNELPGIKFVDATEQFETARQVKSSEELIGIEESAYILDQCFHRLLEIAKPGITEREIGSEMYRVAYALGSEDPLFLSMHSYHLDGQLLSSFAPPRDRILLPHDIHTFSFEIIGPRGYWTELARMVTFAKPREADWRLAQATSLGITAAGKALVPGATPDSVQRAILHAISEKDAESTYWSGHSIGLDVLEHPWIGLNVVEDDTNTGRERIAPGNAFAIHPMLRDRRGEATGYMADIFIVEETEARKLSEFPTALHRISKGEVDVVESR